MTDRDGPRVSVVMAVYDGEPYLHEAIESILDQTLADFELIVVDDGSRDATPKILAAFAASDARVVLLRNDDNRGLIFSLNRGIERARGELIARMDADDVSDPERLEKQVRFLDEHPEVGLLGTGYERLHADGSVTRHQPPTDHTTIRWRLLFGNIWPHPAVMFRRNLLGPGEVVYGDFLHADDYEPWARLARRTRTATVPEPLVTIRTHDTGGISAANETTQLRMVAAISAEQIAALVPRATPPTATEATELREIADPSAAAARLQDARRLLPLFDALARAEDIDIDRLSRIRRSWLRRTLGAALRAGRLTELMRSGFIHALVRTDPLALTPGFGGASRRNATPATRSE